jgi:hypothetical protein
MPEYGTCECSSCYRRIPKPEAYRITIEREKGHSSGSVRFSRRSTSYSTGRTYYAKQDVWLCSGCYAAYQRKQNMRAATSAVVFVAAFAGLAMFTFALSNSRVPNSTVTTTITGSPPYQTANLVRTEDPKPPTSSPALKDVSNVQNRLIELGYLVGPADGVWGSRSRNALLAFKASNGLPADDKWDPIVNSRLLSTNVVRGPLTAASNQSIPAPPNRSRPSP